jgi:hypothetical protein
MSSSKHWSIKVPEDKVAPAGKPEALAEAKKELGLFKAQHVVDKVCLCELCAETRIRDLAMRFNKLRFASKGAPRTNHITKNLNNIATKSRQLAAALGSLDDYSRAWLYRPRTPAANGPDLSLLREQAKANDLPPPSLIAPGDGKLVEQLIAMSRYATLLAEEFEIWRLLNAPFPISDIGGNTNMMTQRHGTPTERLVIGAYHIYEDFRPEGARKTENGSFHTFVNQIFLFATGTRKGQSTLYMQVKRMLGRNGVLTIRK